MDPTPLLPLHTLPVPAKSSETRAILLLISGHAEHLWIRIEIVFVKARKTSKKSLAGSDMPRSGTANLGTKAIVIAEIEGPPR
jgi:hypothetical protein